MKITKFPPILNGYIVRGQDNFVIKGAVRSYYLKDGIEVNTRFALENDIVGSLPNFQDKSSRETIELLENSTLISINLKQIKPLMFSNIQVANFINAIIIDYAYFGSLLVLFYKKKFQNKTSNVNFLIYGSYALAITYFLMVLASLFFFNKKAEKFKQESNI